MKTNTCANIVANQKCKLEPVRGSLFSEENRRMGRRRDEKEGLG